MPKTPSRPGPAARALLLAVGAMLVLHAAVMPLLPILGESATGRITEIRRELGDRRDPKANSYSYSVGFEFPLPDGSVVHGNTKVIGSSYSAGISKGPARIHYLAFLPWVNALERDTRLDVGTVVMLAAGLLLCITAVKPASPLNPTRCGGRR